MTTVSDLFERSPLGASSVWEEARRGLDGLPGDPRNLNIAHEAVDRHAAGPRKDELAIRWLGKRGDVHDVEIEITAAIAAAEAGTWEPVADLRKNVHTPPM